MASKFYYYPTFYHFRSCSVYQLPNKISSNACFESEEDCIKFMESQGFKSTEYNVNCVSEESCNFDTLVVLNSNGECINTTLCESYPKIYSSAKEEDIVEGALLYWKDPDEYVDEYGYSTSGWVIVDEVSEEVILVHRIYDELASIEVLKNELFEFKF